MNKYEIIINMLWRIVLGLFMIAVGIFFVAIPFIMIVDAGGKLITMLALITTSLGGFFILQGISVAFFNQAYRSTGYVKGGQSTIEANQTIGYIKRTMWFQFIGCLAHVALAIFYFCCISIEKDFKVIYIVCGIIALIIAVLYFLGAGRRKVDLKYLDEK